MRKNLKFSLGGGMCWLFSEQGDPPERQQRVSPLPHEDSESDKDEDDPQTVAGPSRQ